MSSTAALTAVLLLIVGLSIALVAIQDKQTENEQNLRVSTPAFGGADARHAEGPWPECLEQNGEWCLQLIEGFTKKQEVELVIIRPNDKPYVYKGAFRKDRVRIFVDDDNVVTKIPSRG